MLSVNMFVVTPEGDEGWRVLVGETSSWRVFNDKADAIARAKELAILAEGQLVVRDKAGQVQTQKTFGRRVHV